MDEAPPAQVSVTSSDTHLPLLPPVEIEAARKYVRASRAASTHRAYATDWKLFQGWCRARSVPDLPASPALVAVYLSALSTGGKAPATIARAVAAIAHYHRQAQLPAPHRTDQGAVVSEVLSGIRRSWIDAPARKEAADAEVILKLLSPIQGYGMAAVRDRALISFGMALAARRSELVALDVSDIAWSKAGARVTIRRSKTDQEAAGAVVAVPEGRRLTPLAHLRAWVAAAGLTEGPLFRPLWKGGRVRDSRLSPYTVALIVQSRAEAAGLDPTRYAGHSLRAGFITEAARSGADIWKIQQVSRHKTLDVLSGYVRDARLFDDHAGDSFL